jgi:hypothetical protein
MMVIQYILLFIDHLYQSLHYDILPSDDQSALLNRYMNL